VKKGLLILVLTAAAFGTSVSRASITVDGALGDWGATGGSIVPADGGASVWGVAGGTGAYPTFIDSGVTVRYHLEDTSDTAGDGGYVGPHFGGQNYDGEFMGVSIKNGFLYIAIVSGQRPDNGVARFGPGDIRLITDSDAGLTTYGIEVGGNVGGSAGGGITEGVAGTTYNLNSNGFTNATSPLLATHASQTAGSLFRNPTWLNDPIPPPGPTQLQFNGTTGQFVTLADYYFSRDATTTQHSIIELAIPYDGTVFAGAHERLKQVEWRPSCGNDELIVNYPDATGPTPELPEPASLIVWGLMLGLVAMSQRRHFSSRFRGRFG